MSIGTWPDRRCDGYRQLQGAICHARRAADRRNPVRSCIQAGIALHHKLRHPMTGGDNRAPDIGACLVCPVQDSSKIWVQSILLVVGALLRSGRKLTRRGSTGQGTCVDYSARKCISRLTIRYAPRLTNVASALVARSGIKEGSVRIDQCSSVRDFRALAKRRLPGPIFHYIDGAADDEVTYRRNTEAYERCDLVPSVLAGVDNREHVDHGHGSESEHALVLFTDRASATVSS